MGEGRCRCCCMSYRTRVTIYAVTNVFLTGMQLFLPLISTGFMIYFKATRQNFEAKYILHEETMSIFQRIPMIFIKPVDSSKISIADIGDSPSPLQSDMHVWASWLFMKIVMFIYSFVLYSGARKKNYNGVLAWFALNLPMAVHALMVLSMDLGMGLMSRKPLNFQIFQYCYSVYQILGLIFVYMFLRKIHFLRGVRYPEFKRETDVKFRDASNLNL